jgi:short-subunit dehydrogenase
MTQGPIWITGASSGIGRALALRLARDGRKVIASARSADALAALAKESPNIAAWPLDITDAAACETAVAGIEAAHGPLALAVLNAGTHKATPAADFRVGDIRLLVETNLMGAVHALAPLLARRTKHVAIVASVAGYSGLPTAAGYGATKAALINLCEALKPECDALGIKLQLVDPGFVKTPLTDKNDFPMPFLMDVDDAVDAFVKGLESDAFEIVFPRRFALILKFLRLLPYRLYFPLVKRTTGK